MTGSAHGRSPGRVLIIEDDPVAAYFAMHVLGKRGGLDVRHTPDPAVALSLARSETWDLVLTDAELPGMTGLELLAALRRLSPALPVAVITAHESLDPALRALRDAADEFLQKPVRPDQLLATVTALVARGRAAREANGMAGQPADPAAGPAARHEDC
jgi:DNA-binding response OmpR family regulator